MDDIIERHLRPNGIAPEDVLLCGADRALMQAHAITELHADLAWIEESVELGRLAPELARRAEALARERHRTAWGAWLD